MQRLSMPMSSCPMCTPSAPFVVIFANRLTNSSRDTNHRPGNVYSIVNDQFRSTPPGQSEQLFCHSDQIGSLTMLLAILDDCCSLGEKGKQNAYRRREPRRTSFKDLFDDVGKLSVTEDVR